MRLLDHRGRFLPRQDGLQFEGRAIYHDRKRYACIWLNGRDVKLHILVWERANGPKPAGHEIHHRDHDKSNFDLSNLELLTCSDHQRLHAGWVRGEDGQWAAKPCTACLEILPLTEFYPRKGYTPSARCKACHCAATKAWGEKNPEKRREISRSWWERRTA